MRKNTLYYSFNNDPKFGDVSSIFVHEKLSGDVIEKIKINNIHDILIQKTIIKKVKKKYCIFMPFRVIYKSDYALYPTNYNIEFFNIYYDNVPYEICVDNIIDMLPRHNIGNVISIPFNIKFKLSDILSNNENNINKANNVLDLVFEITFNHGLLMGYNLLEIYKCIFQLHHEDLKYIQQLLIT